jgi:tRNA-dihydrouridine synthase B
MTIHVGSLDLGTRVLLAPMSGVTDAPFRRLVRELGPGQTYSEMIASREMVHASVRSRRMAERDCDPAMMAEAARIAEAEGADYIDINMGCPARKVVGSLCGSALMRDLPLASEIIAATVGAVSVPVTLKMRTGWDDNSRNAPDLARIAEDAGIQLITVHGRTRAQFYEGRADWRFIRAVKEAVAVPVVANGDIASYDDIDACLEQSCADGVMIGRGAYGRPWFIAQASAYLQDGVRRDDPPATVRLHLIERHYAAMQRHQGIDAAVRNARKHFAWYLRDMPGARPTLDAINREKDPRAVVELLRRCFDAAETRAAA